MPVLVIIENMNVIEFCIVEVVHPARNFSILQSKVKVTLLHNKLLMKWLLSINLFASAILTHASI